MEIRATHRISRLTRIRRLLLRIREDRRIRIRPEGRSGKSAIQQISSASYTPPPNQPPHTYSAPEGRVPARNHRPTSSNPGHRRTRRTRSRKRSATQPPYTVEAVPDTWRTTTTIRAPHRARLDPRRRRTTPPETPTPDLLREVIRPRRTDIRSALTQRLLAIATDTTLRRERPHIAHRRVPTTLLLLTGAAVPTPHLQTAADAPTLRLRILLLPAVAGLVDQWRTAAAADTPEAVPLTDTNYA